MATVTITIPDALVPRLLASARFSYPQYSALTPDATFKAITGDLWKVILTNYESKVATVTASTKASTDAAGIG